MVRKSEWSSRIVFGGSSRFNSALHLKIFVKTVDYEKLLENIEHYFNIILEWF